MPRRLAAVLIVVLTLLTSHLAADPIASQSLHIQGVELRVETVAATAQIATPCEIQTSFGGKQNDDAPAAPDLTAVGELSGPALDRPVMLSAIPGHRFSIPPLPKEGTYFLRNVRLVRNGTQFVRKANPSVASITVTNALQTTVTVHKLSPEEMRARGIFVDARNYDVYEYNFSFLINGQTVVVPYPVVVDRNTQQVIRQPELDPYRLPPDQSSLPPRWMPPVSFPFVVEPLTEVPPAPPGAPDVPEPGRIRPSVHAAIVLSNDMAVLHDFFLVSLLVQNGASAGTDVRLDDVTAQITVPNALRIAQSTPAVSFGQPVPIVDSATGATFLVAQGKGNAEWDVEGLQPGTHIINLDVRATLKSPGQPDIELRGTPSAAIVVHDPRFNLTFSHPQTVRSGIDYSTFAFITNVSGAPKTISISNESIPLCSTSTYDSNLNVCRVDGYPATFSRTLTAGDTGVFELRLRSSLTGNVFATGVAAGTAFEQATIILTTGVTATGIPLSPATLVLPYYARTPYLSDAFLSSETKFLGIAYSLATAPFSTQTASFPRVAKSDVFAHAVSVARAGQRMFIGESPAASLSNLALDLLGNSSTLYDLDQLRRGETTGTEATAALGSEIANRCFTGSATYASFADDFTHATSHRTNFAAVLVHGGDVSLSIKGTASNRVASNSLRQLPYAAVFNADRADGTEKGALGIVGRVSEPLDVTFVSPADADLTFDVWFPLASGEMYRGSATVHAVSNQPLAIHLENGVATSNSVTIPMQPVALTPIAIVAARQDLYLDPSGHKVSVLFNRPIIVADPDGLASQFTGHMKTDAAVVGIAYESDRRIAGAALQPESRIVNLNFDSVLSRNATTTVRAASIVDASNDVPMPVTIDNDTPAGLISGYLLNGDGAPVADVDVQLSSADMVQYSRSAADGRFFFEYVPRDPSRISSGAWELLAQSQGRYASVKGAVRLTGTVQNVNLLFLGRGSAEGVVRYDDGTIVAGAHVVIASTMFREFRSVDTDATGHFRIGDLPVGPVTLSAVDARGNIGYAANGLRTAGELLQQDIVIFRRPFPGIGTVRGTIRLANGDHLPIPGTHVGVYSAGYAFADSYTDAQGRFEFTHVPSGFVTFLAENYAVSPSSIAVDFDLAVDEIRDLGDVYVTPASAETFVHLEGSVSLKVSTNSTVPVPNAVIRLAGLPAQIADGQGHFSIDSVPQSLSHARIDAYDPVSGRTGSSALGDLLPDANNYVPITIDATNAPPSGTGTIRALLLDAKGQPVAQGFDVFEPGERTVEGIAGSEAGTWEFRDVAVGQPITIVAVATSAAGGDQIASSTVTVAYAGQTASTTLRLPGSGSANVEVLQQTESGTSRVAATVKARYLAWSSSEQTTVVKEISANTDGSTYAVFPHLPAGQIIAIETVDALGYASDTFRLAFDGDAVTKSLVLSKLSRVRGHVFAPDGVTPIAGATVKLTDGVQLNTSVSSPDGSFEFRNVTSGTGFTVTAEAMLYGTYRTGQVSGSTPPNGGVVDSVALVTLHQGYVRGSVVDANGAAVPYARYWVRELAFPQRSFGSNAEPRTADANGRFEIRNIFEGPLRASAVDPQNPDTRGEWAGSIVDEGSIVNATVVVGADGTATIRAAVVDPNQQNNRVPNVDVLLLKDGSPFDAATTDGSGEVTFVFVPVGNYQISAYSKALAKAGATQTFSVARDETAEQQVTLTFVGSAYGTLSDPQESNSPVPGSQVTMTQGSYSTRTTSAPNGTFEFLGVREGSLSLVARDPLSNRLAKATSSITQENPRTRVDLQLEPTSVLTVNVFLPDDAGNNSGTLAPLTAIDVTQDAPGGSYERTMQGNALQFPRLLRGLPYHVKAVEIGGEGRIVEASGSFDASSATSSLSLVFPAHGSLFVRVMQDGLPKSGALVSASGNGLARSGYTDMSGSVLFRGLPVGTAIWVSAEAVDAVPRLTASTTANIPSASSTTEVTLTLGSYASISGHVEAEAGGPSTRTRVLATINAVQLETRTDGDGHYVFQGLATPANGIGVRLVFLGDDDATIGSQQLIMLTTGQDAIVDATLDTTSPRLLSIFPTDGSSAVSPDTNLVVQFSEAINPSKLLSGVRLELAATAAPVALSLSETRELSDHTISYTLTPPPPSGEAVHSLQSNSLYRVVVSTEATDLAGHAIEAPGGAGFTTSDYSNPQIVRLDPLPSRPLMSSNVAFDVTFSKALASTPWQPNGSGRMQLLPIDHVGGSAIGSPLAAIVELDAATASILHLVPSVQLQPASFYRLTITGAVDQQGRGLVDANGNPISTATFDFFSYDEVAPVVTLDSPVANGYPLLSGVVYRVNASLTNPDGSQANDVERVEYFSVDANGNDVLVGRSFAYPHSFSFVIPDGVTSYTLKAIATDLSGNRGEAASETWSVQPKLPPSVTSVALTPSAVYAGNTVHAIASIEDQGIEVSVRLDIVAHKAGATVFTSSASKTIRRAAIDQPWPFAEFDVVMPQTLTPGTDVAFTATAIDWKGNQGTKNTSIAIAGDVTNPAIEPLQVIPISTSGSLPAGTFANGDTYKVRAIASDGETGIASVAFTIDEHPYVVNAGDGGTTFDSATGKWTIDSPVITVQARNNDLAVAINATATDHASNSSTVATSVQYIGLHDPNAPVVAWMCPLQHAVFPASQTTFATTLKVYALSQLALNVVFDVPGIGSVTATRKSAQSFEYDANVSFATPPAGTPFTIRVKVDDGDGQHLVELPIDIDLVAFDDVVQAGETRAVLPNETASYTGKSILVDGGRLVPQGALSLRDLVVLDGGVVTTLPTTTYTEQRLTVDVADHLYVDCTSTIDVSARGYLGGLQQNFDQNGSNGDTHGITVGGAPGASIGSSGSFAGIGGADEGATSNPVYGSIVAPTDLGSGGGASGSNARGAQGGGAASITTSTGLGRLVVAGTITADGESGVTRGGAGSGGSLNLVGHEITIGAATSIRANGGDDDGAVNTSRGGGGGRITILASDVFDLDATSSHLAAHGGRNMTGESPAVLDGGAGTMFIRKPGETNGELFVAALDDRAPTSIHQTRATVLGGEALSLDSMILGPRALVRADNMLTIGGFADDRSKAQVDPTAVLLLQTDLPSVTATTTPSDGGAVIQASSAGATFTATSLAGIDRVTATWSLVSPDQTVHFYDQPLTSSQSHLTLNVPADAVAGSSATLTLHAIDRAGRTFDTALVSFTVVANSAPVVDAYDVTPLSLYPGGTAQVHVKAHDDIAVKSIVVTSQIGTGTPVTQSQTFNAPAAEQTFAIPIAKETVGGQTMTVTMTVDDQFPGRTPAPNLATVSILADQNPPSGTINAPTDGAMVQELTSVAIDVTATDAEVGVQRVTAGIEGGSTIELTAGPGDHWTGSLTMPNIVGTQVAPRTLTVNAYDYAGNSSSAPITLNVQPVVDPDAPVIAPLCPSNGALLVAGTPNQSISVTAVPAAGSSVASVTISDGTTMLTATQQNGTNTWTATGYSVPNVADGTPLSFVITATGAGGHSSDYVLSTTIVSGTVVPAGTTIGSTDSSYDGRTIIVSSGTVTINGQHNFTRVVVQNGATLVQGIATATNSVDKPSITANLVYVGCGGSIDVSGKGYAPRQSYEGATIGEDGSGGSHIGLGGWGVSGSPYGSVYRPAEAGAGAVGSARGYGGGIVRITAQNVVLDGKIKANGVDPDGNRSGAGGSVWITTETIGGAGSIEATVSDGVAYGGGGGGAIAIEYGSGAGAILSHLNARGGTSSRNANGGAGTIYLKSANSTYGDVTIDNGGLANGKTTLPSFGNGTAQPNTNGATIVTSKTTRIPEYFVGHWVEVSRNGTPLGTWRVSSVALNTYAAFMLQPNAGETLSFQPGDTWQGVYRFDSMNAPSASTILSDDPIRVGSTTIGGAVSISALSGTDLTVTSSGKLMAPAGTNKLTIDVSHTLTVAVGGSIDVSGQGYAPGQSHDGAGIGENGSGGSHIGSGGWGVSGSTYGSVYRPAEAGAGAVGASRGYGGGIVRITAQNVVLDGKIKANGVDPNADRSGAGGSVWISTETIGGAGSIEATVGDRVTYGGGGGGAIAIEYGSAAGSILSNLNARGGTSSQNANGGAGTIYLKSANSTYGDVTIDNGGLANGKTTLPSFGNGTAQPNTNGATIVTSKTTRIPEYFVGHWVEVSRNGTPLGTWRVSSVALNTYAAFMLQPNAGETLAFQSGDTWQGVYRFDSKQILNGATLDSTDPIRIGAQPLLFRPAQVAAPEWPQVPSLSRLQIDPLKIHIENNEGVAVVTAAAGAISGDAALTVTIDNVTVGTAVPLVPVRPDGSFEALIGAVEDDRISITIIAGNGTSIGPIDLGFVPKAANKHSRLPRSRQSINPPSFAGVAGQIALQSAFLNLRP